MMPRPLLLAPYNLVGDLSKPRPMEERLRYRTLSLHYPPRVLKSFVSIILAADTACSGIDSARMISINGKREDTTIDDELLLT